MESYRPGESFSDSEGGPEMVVVPAGRFAMGSSAAEIGALMGTGGDTGAYSDGSSAAHPAGAAWWRTEGPQHEVIFTRGFAVARHPVTRGQFAAFVADTGTEPGWGGYMWRGGGFQFDDGLSWRTPGFQQDDRHPVVGVSWEDARAYTRWLSARTGHTYRLPSEAEREYATRAGTTTAYWWGDAIARDQATYGGGDTPGAGTAPVDRHGANAWGVCGVHGNVWEWCGDRWHETYDGAPQDGAAWENGPGEANERRVIRGGSWVLYPLLLRAAARLYNPAGGRSHDLGFRVMRDV